MWHISSNSASTQTKRSLENLTVFLRMWTFLPVTIECSQTFIQLHSNQQQYRISYPLQWPCIITLYNQCWISFSSVPCVFFVRVRKEWTNCSYNEALRDFHPLWSRSSKRYDPLLKAAFKCGSSQPAECVSDVTSCLSRTAGLYCSTVSQHKQANLGIKRYQDAQLFPACHHPHNAEEVSGGEVVYICVFSCVLCENQRTRRWYPE